MHVACNMQRTIACNMQRGTVQAIPATFPETLTTPSKIAQKASLLDMLNDICVSQARAAVPASASPRHRTHRTRHTARRAKVQPLGQRVRLRYSAAALRAYSAYSQRAALTAGAPVCRGRAEQRRRAAAVSAARTHCSAFALPDLLGSQRGAVRLGDWVLCFRALGGAGIRSMRSTRA